MGHLQTKDSSKLEKLLTYVLVPTTCTFPLHSIYITVIITVSLLALWIPVISGLVAPSKFTNSRGAVNVTNQVYSRAVHQTCLYLQNCHGNTILQRQTAPSASLLRYSPQNQHPDTLEVSQKLLAIHCSQIFIFSFNLLGVVICANQSSTTNSSEGVKIKPPISLRSTFMNASTPRSPFSYSTGQNPKDACPFWKCAPVEGHQRSFAASNVSDTSPALRSSFFCLVWIDGQKRNSIAHSFLLLFSTILQYTFALQRASTASQSLWPSSKPYGV